MTAISVLGLVHTVATGARVATVPAANPRGIDRAPGAAPQVGTRDATGAGQSNSATSFFSGPLLLPGSDNIGEPSLIADNAGNIYAAGPGGLATANKGVYLWKSSDGGSSFAGPISTANVYDQNVPVVAGGDADLAVDRANDLFAIDLWLGNSSMEVSSDGANTWTGIPWGHLTPVDDRPWLTYDPASDDLYAVWDGTDGVHVGKALIRHEAPTSVAGVNTQGDASLLFVQDIVAVPESATPQGTAVDSTGVRECVCPPGNIAIDRDDNLWFAYSRQNGPNIGGGIGIAESKDGGRTWTQSSIAGSGHGNPPTAIGLSFPFMRSDSEGNLYVTWSEPVTLVKGQNPVAEVFYSWLTPGATQWHAPVQLSNSPIGAVFPAIAVAKPGTVDVAWYDETPYLTGGGQLTSNWNLDIAQSVDATTNADFVTAVAAPGIYVGDPQPCGGITGGGPVFCPPRFPGFGDFFSMLIDHSGMADIVSDVNVGQNVYKLMFLHQTAPLSGPPVVTANSQAQCPAGLTGTPPSCNYQPSCPSGTTGVFPACQLAQNGGGSSYAGSSSGTGGGGIAYGAGGGQAAAPPGAPAVRIPAAERASVAGVNPRLEGSATSGGLALLVAGALLGALATVALLARVRRSW